MTTLTEPEAPAATAATGEGSTPGRGLGRQIWWWVCTLVVIVLAVISALVTVIPLILGAVPLTVLTGSMRPGIQPGDVVVAAPVAAHDLRLGDIVTFQPESDNPTLITHRIVELSDGDAGVQLITRGDANSADDPQILAEQVRGRMLYVVPKIGYVTNMVSGDLRGPLITIAGFGLVGYAVFTFVRRPRGASERNTP